MSWNYGCSDEKYSGSVWLHTYIHLLVNVIAEQCALDCFQKIQQNKKGWYQMIVYKYYLYLTQR